MIINLEFDAQAQAAPQSFRDAIQTAADIIDETLTDSITVNIAVGYDELTPVNGSPQPLSPGTSEGGVHFLSGVPLGTLPTFTMREADPHVTGPADSATTSADLQSINVLQLSGAEAKALGALPAGFASVDGSVGFSATIPASSLIAAGLHELTHALGRVAGSSPDLFDLYRFTSPGVHLLTGGTTAPPAYFSLDGGVTDLGDYGQASDPSDFLKGGPLTPHDALNESFNSTTYQSLSAVDVLQMETLGFHGATDPQPIILSNGSGGMTAGVVFSNPELYDWGIMTAGPGGDVWHPLGNDGLKDIVGKVDFNNDGAMDIAWRDKTTGELSYVALSTSGSVAGFHDVGPTSLDYVSLGAGDFNGDGVQDIAFREVSTGQWGFMSVNPGGGETWHGVGPSSAGYDAVAVGEFLGNGRADIAFRNPVTGDFGFMSVASGDRETWNPVGPTSPDYAVIGFGDFNADGVSDVAFRNMSTGDWGYMSINPGGGETWRPVGQTSIQYAAVGSGDYNGDGLTDVAFRQMATGAWGYMTAGLGGGEIWHPIGGASTDYFAV